MFQDAFEKLELEEIALVLDRVNPLLRDVQFDPVEATVMAADLSFYPNHRLLEIADHTVMPPHKRWVIDGKTDAVVLDFTNGPIYQLNKIVPIKLNEQTAPDYAKLFFTFVRGKHGRFIITENIDDILWKEDPPPAARKAISKMIVPLNLLKTDADGTIILECTMMFKDALFKGKINIKPDGMVNLSDEEILIEDMPVIDDTFGL